MTNATKSTTADGLCFRGVLKHVEQSKSKEGQYLPFGRAVFSTEKGDEKINIQEVLKHPMGDVQLSAWGTLINAQPGSAWELIVFAEGTIYNARVYVNLTATEAFPLD
jgi:hypothetical protein